MTLITPYGGKLVDLFLRPATRDLLPSIQISERSRCDLELLATGGFSPLDHFMSHADYDRVLDEMRLANGMLFPIPITLPVHDNVDVGQDITLRGPRIELRVNGREAITWADCPMLTGHIGLQAEGAAIEVRSLKFQPL